MLDLDPVVNRWVLSLSGAAPNALRRDARRLRPLPRSTRPDEASLPELRDTEVDGRRFAQRKDGPTPGLHGQPGLLCGYLDDPASLGAGSEVDMASGWRVPAGFVDLPGGRSSRARPRRSPASTPAASAMPDRRDRPG